MKAIYTIFVEPCGSGLSHRASNPMTWVQIPAAPYMSLWWAVEFSSEIGISLNFTAEHTENYFLKSSNALRLTSGLVPKLSSIIIAFS
jgi:hypothetical protein